MFYATHKSRRGAARGSAGSRAKIGRFLTALILIGLMILMPAISSYATAIPIESGKGNAEVDAGAADGEDPFDGGNKGETAFSLISGKITMIDQWNDSQFIRVTDENGGETDFVIAGNETVFSDLNGLVGIGDIEIGKTVDAYYVLPPIMTLQYPPRFTASVILVRNEGHAGSAYVGIVDKDGLASDGSVKLNVSEETKVCLQSDGKDFGGKLESRIIIAYFAITTRSMPPIALVQKVVVLDKMGVPVFYNGNQLFNAAAVIKPDGTIMAPIRAIAEAAGFNVEWDDVVQGVRVGVAIYFKIGSDEYTVGRAMPQKLDAAAELINSRTYVPISFYQKILGMEFDDSYGLINLVGK